MVLPPCCPGCGREGTLLCAACRHVLARRLDEPAGAPLGLAVMIPSELVQLEWCAAFSGPARAALHALKYDGEQRLAEPLGQLLAERWLRVGIGGDVLVPVPIHGARLGERGFNQAALLALAVGRRLGLPVVHALEREQRTVAQHALGRGARAANVGGAFRCTQRAAGLRGRWVILVDDVMTTGATLSGCAAALERAHLGPVSAMTVARER